MTLKQKIHDEIVYALRNGKKYADQDVDYPADFKTYEIVQLIDKYVEEVTAEKVLEVTEQRNEALESLLDMWNQYCPLPWTHMFMSAGEGAEETLDKYNLLKGNREADYDAFTTLQAELSKLKEK